MNPFSKLHEAFEQWNAGDSNRVVGVDICNLMGAVKDLLASPEFKEARLMAQARAHLGSASRGSLVVVQSGNSAPRKTHVAATRECTDGPNASYCITVGREWRP